MMKHIVLALCLLGVSVPAMAQRLQVVTTYPYIADIVEQVGGADVGVHALAGGQWDPHTIVPRPSFIAKLRRADLLIINGAQLEIGWLPPLMKQANNPKINVGTEGLLDLSRFVELIDVPSAVSRAHGDIHPDGNPHFYLDPYNVPRLSAAIAERLSQLDSRGASGYAARNADFTRRWNEKLKGWDAKLRGCQGSTVVEYHKNYDYFLKRYGIRLLGTVELLPGIPPTSGHIAELTRRIGVARVRCILQDVYNPQAASAHLSAKTGVPIVRLPHDVGAARECTDIFTLFDEIVRRLSHE